MTTATTTKKKQTGPLDELKAVEEQLQVARAERERLGDEATAFFNELSIVEAELGEIARNGHEQFDAGGLPKPDTEAAKLRAQLTEGAASNWPQILTGADGRVSALEQEVGKFIQAHYAQLVEHGTPEDQLVADDVNSAVAALVEALRAYIGRHGDRSRLTIPVPGIDGRWVPGLEAAGSLLRAVEKIDLPAPTPKIPND